MHLPWGFFRRTFLCIFQFQSFNTYSLTCSWWDWKSDFIAIILFQRISNRFFLHIKLGGQGPYHFGISKLWSYFALDWKEYLLLQISFCSLSVLHPHFQTLTSIQTPCSTFAWTLIIHDICDKYYSNFNLWLMTRKCHQCWPLLIYFVCPSFFMQNTLQYRKENAWRISGLSFCEPVVL